MICGDKASDAVTGPERSASTSRRSCPHGDVSRRTRKGTPNAERVAPPSHARAHGLRDTRIDELIGDTEVQGKVGRTLELTGAG